MNQAIAIQENSAQTEFQQNNKTLFLWLSASYLFIFLLLQNKSIRIINAFLLKTFALLTCFINVSMAETETITMKVDASAYSSTIAQTNSSPFIGAWGSKLVPGKKSIAISRDLLKKGLKHNSVVKIEGLDGEYVVKDKMHKRWTKKIDIYMGVDTEAAKEWGVREVTITFETKKYKG